MTTRPNGCSQPRAKITLLHIATSLEFRNRGVGTALVRWVQMQYAGLIIEAETDNDAVGFYRAAGFEIVSLAKYILASNDPRHLPITVTLNPVPHGLDRTTDTCPSEVQAATQRCRQFWIIA
ncbi:hypothetical protein NCCP2495_30180 [Dietzia sp. NCCP-2495]|uniref:GNAT family N-acetyltransferase n=1 Tax=Dietzia sp. NCCP-2495 TaxID=2934675 RepID=UPI00280F4117|nr:hypothetical protein NCCP2495_30180 [Dietzia sp. NCCP-2495]